MTATNQQADTAYWMGISNSTNPRHFRQYLTLFPNGQFADLAREKIAEFESAAIREQSLWGRLGRTGRFVVYIVGGLASLAGLLAYFNIAPNAPPTSEFLSAVERSRFKPDYSDCSRYFPDSGACVMNGTVYWWNPDSGMFELQPNSSPGRP